MHSKHTNHHSSYTFTPWWRYTTHTLSLARSQAHQQKWSGWLYVEDTAEQEQNVWTQYEGHCGCILASSDSIKCWSSRKSAIHLGCLTEINTQKSLLKWFYICTCYESCHTSFPKGQLNQAIWQLWLGAGQVRHGCNLCRCWIRKIGGMNQFNILNLSIQDPVCDNV